MSEEVMRWSLHQIPATKAPKMLERRDGMWVLHEDHEKALNASQARLSEAVKVLEGMTEAFVDFTSQAPTMLSCGRHCTAEIEHMEEEAYASAHNHAAFQLRQAKAFLATLEEENE